MAPENTNTSEARRMEHAEATRIQAPTRYLQGELSPSEVEAFEEHYFSCMECAEEVRLGHTFAENARAVFRDHANLKPLRAAAAQRPPAWWERFRGAFAGPIPLAVAACLVGMIGFQNAITIPHLKTEVGELSSGVPPFAFPLKSARGNEAVTVPHNSVFFMPYFYLPGGAASGHYIVDIQPVGGAVRKQVKAPAPRTGEPLNLLLLRSEFPNGPYTVTVHSENSPAVIATYTMDLSTN